LTKKTALIIGGGPAGLTAAYEFLKHTDIQPVVVEMSDYWGGISRTVDYKGNKIDIGGHRFFSKSDVVMQWWKEILPIQSEQEAITLTYQNKTTTIAAAPLSVTNPDKVMLIRKRKSRIFYNKQFIDYPIALTPSTIRKIGVFATVLIGISYLKSVLFPIANEKTLEDFFINRFGKRLYKTFFKEYTEKVWGVPCSEITAEWGAQRIKGLSIKKAIGHFVKKQFQSKKVNIAQKDTETSLIEYFLYPKYGPGQMWEEVASTVKEKGGILINQTKVTKINIQEDKVVSVVVKNEETGSEQEIACDYCLSTMPVKELIKAFNSNATAACKEVADGLCYRDFITVGLLLKKINYTLEDNWIYIQEPYVKVGRLQIFNNWSPFLVKEADTIWMGLEYFCNENDEIWNKTNEELTNLAIAEMVQLGFINEKDYLDGVVIRMPKTYPAYFGTYQRFNEIRAVTDKIDNLFLVGRNGMHKYNNQDHSMLTAIQAVQNIKNKVTDKQNIWNINTEEEYHEEINNDK